MGINSEDGCSSADKVTRLNNREKYLEIEKPSLKWRDHKPTHQEDGVRTMASVQGRKQLEKGHAFKVWGFTDFLF